MKHHIVQAQVVIASLLLASCSGLQSNFTMEARGHIKHVVVIIQENRSFDNLFQGYPGADTQAYGLAHDGTRVPLRPVSLKVGYDLSNGFRDFIRSYDDGKMDGWDLRRAFPVKNIPFSVAEYPEFGFVPHNESKLYFDMAHRYVLADTMFQSNIDLSFAAHLYLIAGQAANTVNVPSGRPWGCDASDETRVLTLTDDRRPGKRVFPCFDFETIGDELIAKGLTWTYYAPTLVSAAAWKPFARSSEVQFAHTPDFGQNWTSYDAVAHDRYGPTWANVISPQTRILQDVARGNLASVTWVVPSWKDSDHSASLSATGPQWVASIVNAIGESRFWSSTAIFVLWDDSGGWYDHVPPPQIDADGLGVRIPLLVISPYAKRNHVSHVQYEAAGIVKFLEQVYGLKSLATGDRRANDFSDCFNFQNSTRVFVPFERVDESQFLTEVPSNHPPDSD